jgi:NADPH:quinone reductase-like Zn-dependent oxidoreductase
MKPQDPKRFDLTEGLVTMKAVVTTGHGGYEQLVYRDVPVPVPGPGEVLLQVLASSVNNTDINTRLGWYSAAVTTATQDAATARDANAASPTPDGGWGQPTPFPFIQGTDCCGRVVAVAPGGDTRLIGQRVLVRPSIRPAGFGALDNIWMGSDFDGAFAQFVKVPASEVFAVNSDWSDAELATIPCAYGTAENMLHRAGLRAGEQVVVAGRGAAGQAARRRRHGHRGEIQNGAREVAGRRPRGGAR